MLAIEMQSVTKRFGRKTILNDFHLAVPEQSIFAFVGNNGAGKSTAIRLMLGLLQADAGEVMVLGHSLQTQRLHVLSEVGCLVDAPSAYPNLNAREFLRIAAELKRLPRSEIERVLALVHLQNDAQLAIAHYSLGMKQRLALAHALMGSPKLLILDEPSNGLDPAGIQEIRSLIAALPEQMSTTIFISSHQLDELDKLATHVALLQAGQIRFQTSMDALRRDANTVLHLRVDDAQAASQCLSSRGYEAVLKDAQQLSVQGVQRDQAWQLHECLVHSGIRLHESRNEQVHLERWFHEMSKEAI